MTVTDNKMHEKCLVKLISKSRKFKCETCSHRLDKEFNIVLKV